MLRSRLSGVLFLCLTFGAAVGCSSGGGVPTQESGYEVVPSSLAEVGMYTVTTKVFDDGNPLTSPAIVDTVEYSIDLGSSQANAVSRGDAKLIAVRDSSKFVNATDASFPIPANGDREAAEVRVEAAVGAPPTAQEVWRGGKKLFRIHTDWTRIDGGWAKSTEVMEIYSGDKIVAAITTNFETALATADVKATALSWGKTSQLAKVAYYTEGGPCSGTYEGEPYDFCDDWEDDDLSSGACCQDIFNKMVDKYDALNDKIWEYGAVCATTGIGCALIIRIYKLCSQFNTIVDSFNNCILSNIANANCDPLWGLSSYPVSHIWLPF